MLELVCHPGCIDFLLRFLQLNRLLHFKVRDPLKIFRIVWVAIHGLESSEMFTIVNHHSNQRDEADPDLNAQRLPLFGIDELAIVIIKRLEVEHVQLFQQLVNTFLRIFAFGHL